jgi:tRNA-dihydrouridine synthase B
MIARWPTESAYAKIGPLLYTHEMAIELKPFRIGLLEIKSPVILAALAGYSDLAYRLICRQFGAPYCATEMMLDKLLLIRGKIRSRLFKITPDDHPVAGQLIGNDPATMAQAAVGLAEMGFDAIDLNFACPVRKALSRRRGGFLMSKPAQVLQIVQAVRDAVDKPVTLKLRQKFRADDNEDNFWQIAEGAFAIGASAICIHARSVEVKYFGPADWQFIKSVKQRFPDKTIIGSGDILVPQKALDMLEQTGVDAVAAARGALGNPWFFRQVQDLAAGLPAYKPSLAEQRDVLLRHFHADCELYGLDKAHKHMRGFGVKYARMHPHPKDIRVAFVNVRSAQDWQAVLETHYRD